MDNQDQVKKDLRLTVPAGVTAVLHTGCVSDKGDVVEASGMTEAGEERVYTFEGLAAGTYYYLLSGEGYYTIERRLYVTADSPDEIAVSEDPGRMTGNGYEQTVPVRLFTPEAEKKIFPSDPALWPDYAEVFTTPSFGANKGNHEIASNEEMLAFLAKKVFESSHARLYSIGRSPVHGFDMPIVVCTETDLTGADTLEEAARRIRENGKPTVHYQAQIHGNEPAGGEGAMAMAAMLCGKYGDELLKKVNVYVIPRVNPEGAFKFNRKNVKNEWDMNRDQLFSESVETRNVRKAIDFFRPEVVLDGHEFTGGPQSEFGHYRDIMLSIAAGINNGKEIGDYSLKILPTVVRRLANFGLRGVAYPDATYKSGLQIANSMNPTTGRNYNSLPGAISVLIESRGIHAGKEAFHRRVISQFITIETILKWTAKNAEEIRTIVNAERERIVEAGKHYSEDRRFVLKTEISRSEETAITVSDPTFNLMTGDFVKPEDTSKVYFYDKPTRTRPYPTAYLLPKGEPWSERALEITERNLITHTEIEPGATVLVRQSLGNAKEIALSPEHPVTFPNGAYVFSMAQPTALYLACLMEVDISDSNGKAGSLVQMGIIPEGDGVFPIYRYVRDLEADGGIALQ